MLRETTLMIRNALADPQTGVMATVGSVPKLPNDPNPLRAGVLHILSEYTDEVIAKGEEPTTFPALVVVVDGAARIEGESQRGQVGAPLVLSVMLYDRSRDLVRGKAIGAVVIRGVRRCLNRFFTQSSQDERTMNKIRLLKIERMVEARMPEPNSGDGTITGFVQAVVNVLDLDP